MKATTIKQSRILEKLLPRETADFHYWGTGEIVGKGRALDSGKPYRGSDIPAWSLNALFDIIPSFQLSKVGGKYQLYVINGSEGFRMGGDYDNPYEAFVEMIEWVFKNKQTKLLDENDLI